MLWVIRLAVVAGCVALCGCGPDLKDVANGMNASSDKFRGDDCVAARHFAIDFAHTAPGMALFTTAASALPFVGTPAWIVLTGTQRKKAKDTIDNLVRACGEDSLVPFFAEIAANGNRYAQTWMGVAYDEGTLVTKDPVQAVHWYELAAAQNEPGAEVNLGAHYAAGTGVAKDQARAVALWEAAARRSVPEAEANLGNSYFLGNGLVQDYKQAENYFRAAAMQGLGYAQFMLGRMYEEGIAVQQDDVTAYRWYTLAKKDGDTRADEKLAALGTKLSASDKALAERKADQCLYTQYKECL